MAELIVDPIEEKNKKKGNITSYVLHALFFFLLVFPFLSFPDPPPGQAGILVNLGMPDQGQGDDNAPPPKSSTKEEKPQETPPPPPPPTPKVEPKPEPPKPKPEPVKEKPAQKEVVTDDNSKEIAIQKEKEKQQKEDARKQQAEADKKVKAEQDQARQEQQEIERRKQAAEDAKNKAAEEAARKKAAAEAKAKADADARAKAKSDAEAEAAGLFGGGAGKGKTGKPGNQGDPNGDPNASNLEGISTGSGNVGGGLGNRGVLNAPKVQDNTQKSGRVVINVCVDNAGNVVSAEFTQKGSTSSDGQLRDVAISNAKKFKFAAGGSAEKQCGTITYDFKLR